MAPCPPVVTGRRPETPRGVGRVEEAGGQQMMRAILVVLCVLLSAATASADCAWVLWRYAMASQTGRAEWKIERASSRDVDCRTSLQTTLEEAKRSGGGSGETVIKGDGYITTDKSGRELAIVQYQCLPDTV